MLMEERELRLGFDMRGRLGGRAQVVVKPGKVCQVLLNRYATTEAGRGELGIGHICYPLAPLMCNRLFTKQFGPLDSEIYLVQLLTKALSFIRIS